MNSSGKTASNTCPTLPGPVVSDAFSEPQDEDLPFVIKAQQGDLTSYDALVTRHRGRIFSMIRNMIHNEADAWDLSQEVFIKAWHALPRFEAKARFSTWLYRIAHNAVYDWNRKRRIESVGELDDSILSHDRIDPSSTTTPSMHESPDNSLANGELRVKIEHALGKLSAEHRQVVILKDVQGLSYKEISSIMDSTLGTVMSRLHYARQKLQTLLKDEYAA